MKLQKIFSGLLLSVIISLQIEAQTLSGSLNHTGLTASGTPSVTVDNLVRSANYSSDCYEEVTEAFLYLTLAMNNINDEFSYGENTFNVDVEITIDAMSSGNSTPVFTETFTLAINDIEPEQLYLYDYSNPSTYAAVSYFVVSVTSYNYDDYDFVRDNILLKAEVEVDFKLKGIHRTNTNAILVNNLKMIQNTSESILTLSWNSNACDFSLFQVQILRLYNDIQAINGMPEQNITTTIDWSKAITLETTETEINYTPTQGQGWYTMRVRPIGDYYEGELADYRNFGEWNDPFIQGAVQTFSTSTPSGGAVAFYTDQNKEYVYSHIKAFAQDNKVRETVDFYNGLLMPEQSQVKLQSQDNIIVSDFFYDFSGRSSLNRLPEPVSGMDIQYMTPITMDQSGGTYTAEDFDDNDNYRDPSTMTSNYWDDSNTDISVPDAEGYPFSRTLHWNDGSGRVKETNIPGANHTIANNTTLSYYSIPTSQELAYVFGKEAPSYKSVTKFITINPDNVGAVQYLDKEGKVLASFLTAGAGPDELEYLSNRETQTFEVEINDNNAYGEFGLYADYEFSLTQTTTVYADYSLNVDEIESCSGYCTTCDYAVTLRLIDKNTERDEAEKRDVSYEYVIEPEVCDGAVSAYIFDDGSTTQSITFENLPIGMYKIEKTISVYNINESSISTDNPLGDTYIYEHLNSTSGVKVLAENQINTELGSLLSYLEDDSYNYEDIYNYLDGLTNVNKTYVGHPMNGLVSSYTFSDACCDITVPVKECFEYSCPDPISDFSQYNRFEEHLLNAYLDQYREGIEIYGTYCGYITLRNIKDHIVDYLNDPASYTGPDPVNEITGYGKGKLNKLLYNMLNDPEVSAELDPSKYYTCEMIWESWDAAVQGIIIGLRSEYQGYLDYNFVENFLSNTGKHYKGFTNTAYWGTPITSPTFNSSNATATGGYKSHAYALFEYTSGTASGCESQYRSLFWNGNQWPTGQDTELDETCFDENSGEIICDPYTDKRWEQFYLCAMNGNMEATEGPDYYENLAEDGCLNACESRRDAFEMEATALFEEEGISYSTADVECLVAKLMEKCQSECDVTVYYTGQLNIGTTHIPSGNIVAGQLYKVVKTGVCMDPVIYYNGKPYGPDSYYGDQFYGITGVVNYKARFSQVIPGINIYVYEDNTQYNGVGTTEEIQNVKEAMTYSFEISFPDATGNCQQDEEFLSGVNAAFPSTNILNNSELTSTTSTSFPCNFNASYWNQAHGSPLTVSETDNDRSPLSALLTSYTTSITNINSQTVEVIMGDGIYYEPTLSLSNGTAYTLEYDIKLDDGSVANSLDNFYVVLAQAIPSIDPLIGNPIPTGAPSGGQAISHQTNIHNSAWRTITTHFTLDISSTYPTNSMVLWLYTLQNSGSDAVKVLIDNIKLSPTVYQNCYDLCFKWEPFEITTEPTVYEIPTCNENIKDYLYESIQAQVTECINNTVIDFKNEYMSICADPDNVDDHLVIQYEQGNFQYTLYYYDLAGRLIKTVPPKGIDLSNTSFSATAKPSHALLSTYQHNSLGQLIRKENIDGGETKYWYSSNGLLRYSQNAEQIANGTFSYTLYNKSEQIIESGVGDVTIMATGTTFDDYVNDISWPTTATSERTYIVYNSAYTDPATGVTIEYYGGKTQRFLHGRVSYTYNDDGVYIIYSYDPLGNAEWIIQSVPGLGRMYLAYEYDPLNSLVTLVKFNEEAEEKFFNRYTYDDDKRLLTVETSLNGYIWDTDASYVYYPHGAIKRVVMGDDKLQGSDYTYTIEGWLKGINHSDLIAASDPGADGSGSTTMPGDNFGMTLNYYDGDFSRTGSAFNSTHTSNFTPLHNLYSGNISSVATNIGYVEGSLQYEYQNGEQYTYDEMYRFLQSDFYDYPDATTGWTSQTDFQVQTSYDANGNITAMNRTAYDQGSGSNTMDQLTYHYTPDADGDGIEDDNKLQYISDAVSASSFNDLDDQASTTNYTYDEIGRLLTDNAEGISITWNNQDKPRLIQTTDGTLEFIYDPMGNRLVKKYTNTIQGTVTNTYYIRDAKGNLIASYKEDGGSLTLNEYVIYGINTRLGVWRTNRVISSPGVAATASSSNSATYIRSLGEKTYQLTDHLGNVRTLFSDKKIATSDGGGNYTFSTDITGYSNYYAYGMEMPGRTLSGAEGYHYGYQGKEKDDELKGSGNSYDFGARILDPRVGRWLSVDPEDKSYPHLSPYNAVGNNPILFIDTKGRKFELSKLSEADKQLFLDAQRRGLNSTNNTDRESWYYLTDCDEVITIIVEHIEPGEELQTYGSKHKGTYGIPSETYIAHDIIWNPDIGLAAVNDDKDALTGQVMSAEESLAHELRHALHAIKFPKRTHTEGSTTDRLYDNKEEKRVIEERNEPRTNHSGLRYTIPTPESVSPVSISNAHMIDEAREAIGLSSVYEVDEERRATENQKEFRNLIENREASGSSYPTE